MHLRDWINDHERGASVLAMVKAFAESTDLRVRSISPGTIYAHAREARMEITLTVARAISSYTLACECKRCRRLKSTRSRLRAAVTIEDLEAACARAYARQQSSAAA